MRPEAVDAAPPPDRLMAVGDFFGPEVGGNEFGGAEDEAFDYLDLDSDLLRATTALMKDRPGSNYLTAKPFTAEGSDSFDAAGPSGSLSSASSSLRNPEGKDRLFAPGDADNLWSSDVFEGAGGTPPGGGGGNGGRTHARKSPSLPTQRGGPVGSPPQPVQTLQARVQQQAAHHFYNSAPPVARQAAANPLLRLPPSLPQVDAHINRADLTYAHLTSGLRRERGVRGPPKTKAASKGGGDEDDDGEGEGSGESGFTVGEIRRVVNYIDDMQEGGAGANDGEIDADELQDAFRRAKRAKASFKFKTAASLAMRKLEELMQRHDLSPVEWFQEMDSLGGGNGRITVPELKEGLAGLCSGKAFRKYAFGSEELSLLMKYMDSNGDGTMDEMEVVESLRRLNQSDAEERMEREAGGVMGRLEKYMKVKHMRVSDLFSLLDADGSGSISLEELRKGLVKMAAPSPAQRARVKREREKKAAYDANLSLRAKQDKELSDRMRKAKKSGALEVLHKMDLFMHQQSMRIKDLFTRSGFDKSGDGLLDTDEFMAALRSLGFNTTRQEAFVLIEFLDESGDGQIEAYELEAATRRLNKDKTMMAALVQTMNGSDTASSDSGPMMFGSGGPLAVLTEGSESGANGFTRSGSRTSTLPLLNSPMGTIVNAKRAARKLKSDTQERLQPRKPTHTNFDTHWLASFDKNIGAHLNKAFSKV